MQNDQLAISNAKFPLPFSIKIFSLAPAVSVGANGATLRVEGEEINTEHRSEDNDFNFCLAFEFLILSA